MKSQHYKSKEENKYIFNLTFGMVTLAVMKKLALRWLIPTNIYKGLLVFLQEAESCAYKLRIQMDRGETERKAEYEWLVNAHAKYFKEVYQFFSTYKTPQK